MKVILILFILIGTRSDIPVIGCDLTEIIGSNYTNSDWKSSLSKLRDALLKGDKVSVKSFFDFPILNPGNDIWFVADMKYTTKFDSKNIVPFKESDFDTHYSAILSIDFRKTFEKIDIEKLSKDGINETADMKIVSPATSKMRAKYSEAQKSITLSLITKSPEFGEFTIDYNFKILPSGDIKFTHVKFVI